MNLNQKKEKEGDVPSLCVAHVIGDLLQPIGREMVFIEEDMVVSWFACALKRTCKCSQSVNATQSVCPNR